MSTAFLFAFLLLGFVNPADGFDATLGILLLFYSGLVATGLLWRLIPRLKLSRSILLVLPVIIIFIISSLHTGHAVSNYLSHEPLSETYRSDLDDFLKTVYLMRHGENYYQAFSQAVAQNAFKGYVGNNVWAWRLPTVFYIWSILPLPAGYGIFLAFLLLGSIILVSSAYILWLFLPATQKPKVILAPYLLYPYLHFGIRDQWLLHTEWWALLFVMLGILCTFKKRFICATLCLSLGVLIRELFIVPVFFFCAYWAILNRKWYLLFVPCILLTILFLLHIKFIQPYREGPGTFFSPRVHQISKEIISASFAFGQGEYLFYRFRTLQILYILAIFGVWRQVSARSLLPFILFPASFLFLGSSVYNDYWGIFFVPFVLLCAPLVLAKQSRSPPV